MDEQVEKSERPKAEPGHFTLGDVRESDITPYTGLGYLSKLFRLLSLVLLLMLIVEIIAGLAADGLAALPTLLGEAARLVVMAGVLWGVGDFALLLIDMGHDLRALRIINARATGSIRKGQPKRTDAGDGQITAVEGRGPAGETGSSVS